MYSVPFQLDSINKISNVNHRTPEPEPETAAPRERFFEPALAAPCNESAAVNLTDSRVAHLVMLVLAWTFISNTAKQRHHITSHHTAKRSAGCVQMASRLASFDLKVE